MSRYLVRQSDVKPYSPANHTGTRNFRLIGPETVDAKQVEVLIGEVEKGKGALPHLHTGIEQVCYLLEGTAHVEVGDERFEMRPGEALKGDPGRSYVPVQFNTENRNKRSIAIDLKTTESRDVVQRLVKDAQIVLEGFRPGVAKRLGIDHETLRKANGKIVYCSISG